MRQSLLVEGTLYYTVPMIVLNFNSRWLFWYGLKMSPYHVIFMFFLPKANGKSYFCKGLFRNFSLDPKLGSASNFEAVHFYYRTNGWIVPKICLENGLILNHLGLLPNPSLGSRWCWKHRSNLFAVLQNLLPSPSLSWANLRFGKVPKIFFVIICSWAK